jgi:hypothetical protein
VETTGIEATAVGEEIIETGEVGSTGGGACAPQAASRRASIRINFFIGQSPSFSSCSSAGGTNNRFPPNWRMF